ncbi:MAG: hypothetical protein WCK41_03520 [Actinomycetes bacterium]
MTVIAQSGIQVDLPAGWEGRIQRGPDLIAPAGGALNDGLLANGGRFYTVVHAANFALPTEVADYGGGAVEVMGRKDLLVVLCEFGPESVGQPMFASAGLPTVTANDFGTQSMQRVIEGQGGCQKFFTVQGRAFCLYVVVGSYLRRFRTVPLINELIRGITIT